MRRRFGHELCRGMQEATFEVSIAAEAWLEVLQAHYGAALADALVTIAAAETELRAAERAEEELRRMCAPLPPDRGVHLLHTHLPSRAHTWLGGPSVCVRQWLDTRGVACSGREGKRATVSAERDAGKAGKASKPAEPTAKDAAKDGGDAKASDEAGDKVRKFCMHSLLPCLPTVPSAGSLETR